MKGQIYFTFMSTLLNIEIGKRLNEARKKSGKTIDEVLKIVKISKQSLISYEKGRGNPSFFKIIELCNVYGVSLNYLVYGEDKNYSGISNSLKRKIYSLASLDSDNDISYDSIHEYIRFNNKDLKKYYVYCHAMFTRTKEFSKLEAIDKVLKYIDSEIQ